MRMLPLKLLTMSLAVFLSGCQSTSRDLAFFGEQCSPVFAYTDETKKEIDVEKSYCVVRNYEMNIFRAGPVDGTTRRAQLSFCDRCVGTKNYARESAFKEKVRRAIAGDEGKGQEGFAGEVTESTPPGAVGWEYGPSQED